MIDSIKKLNNDLVLSEYDVLLISDGSGTVLNLCSGWSCIRYQKLNNKIDIHHGGQTWGTNNIAELMPIVSILWLDAAEKHVLPRKILVVTDSEVTVKCGMGEYRRSSNLTLWNSLDYLKSIGYAIQWRHVARNSNPLNSLCDKLASGIRKEIERFQLTNQASQDIVEV